MQASILPFQYGWYWIQAGLETFKKQQMALTFSAFVTNSLSIVSYFFLVVAQIALIVLASLLSFIVVGASRRGLNSERMRLSEWLSAVTQEGVFARLLRLSG